MNWIKIIKAILIFGAGLIELLIIVVACSDDDDNRVTIARLIVEAEFIITIIYLLID
ncbi:hypothetical protein [Eubacterium sp.]|uniref:hypothetical protein n=1 Tax=Eubacterium sp. TaxID=142586 RepID=UPI001E00E678|nr:hypothetical protein [Eubacterium sp.]MBS5619805.1 hypothetical protein [Eubacterium sp.]